MRGLLDLDPAQLEEVAHEVAAALYQATAEEGGEGQPAGDSASTPEDSAPESKDDDVIDAEYDEVKG